MFDVADATTPLFASGSPVASQVLLYDISSQSWPINNLFLARNILAALCHNLYPQQKQLLLNHLCLRHRNYLQNSTHHFQTMI